MDCSPYNSADMWLWLILMVSYNQNYSSLCYCYSKLGDIQCSGDLLLLLNPEQDEKIRRQCSENVYIFISRPLSACHPSNCNSLCL